jgi:hypothetical protein
MINNQTPEELSNLDTNSFTTSQPNAILYIGKTKIVFDKTKIEVQDLLGLYEDLENYLRSMYGVYL